MTNDKGCDKNGAKPLSADALNDVAGGFANVPVPTANEICPTCKIEMRCNMTRNEVYDECPTCGFRIQKATGIGQFGE